MALGTGIGIAIWVVLGMMEAEARAGRPPYFTLAVASVSLLASVLQIPMLLRFVWRPRVARAAILCVGRLGAPRLFARGRFFVDAGGAWRFEGPELRANDVERGPQGWRLADTGEPFWVCHENGARLRLPLRPPGPGFGVRPPLGTSLREAAFDRRAARVFFLALAPHIVGCLFLLTPGGGPALVALGTCVAFWLVSEFVWLEHQARFRRIHAQLASRNAAGIEWRSQPDPSLALRERDDGGSS